MAQSKSTVTATRPSRKPYATLIASAPDLYAALEACEEQLEQMAFMYPEGEWTTVLNQTRAALAKARGMKGGE